MTGLALTARMPPAVAALPRNRAGYPIPWFAAEIDGERDFRVIRAGGVEDALRFGSCWICGRPGGSYRAFVVGPMCAVNRVSAEPPSHRVCAEYAAQVCPFLVNPTMHRRDRGLPDGTVEPPGVMLTRNPGVALVWTTRTDHTFAAPDGGVLFDLGQPTSTSWWAHGRSATRGEVEGSIRSGYPALLEQAEADGALAVAELKRMRDDAMRLMPR